MGKPLELDSFERAILQDLLIREMDRIEEAAKRIEKRNARTLEFDRLKRRQRLYAKIRDCQ